MVAGMVMPLADLRAIYELLFRDGVIVAKKDKRPQSMHPDVEGVTNLKVICAMGSLKSKGCVRETFAWKHSYYYITNKGIAYLRDYLHLPPEIMPAPLRPVWRPASSARVHIMEGPKSCIPKPKSGQESRETRMDRLIYRHKRVGEQKQQSERPPRNCRGSYHCDPSADRPGVQTQAVFEREKDVCRKSSIKRAKQPVSFVPSSSVLPKFFKEMQTVHMAPCAPVKEDLQKCVKLTAVNLPATLEDLECMKMQETTVKETTKDLIPDVTRGETLNLALEVLGKIEPEVDHGDHVAVDQQTIPLLTGLSEKEEQDAKDEEGVLEEVVVTEDTLEMIKQLNAKSESDHDSATSPPLVSDLTEDVVPYDSVDIEDTQKVMEKTIPIKTISKFHVISETSSNEAFETGWPGPVVPSEGSDAALKTTEDHEKEQVWPDFLEG
uniref:uncharacterized protein LOC124074219 n=1 Tax=Scatophagus argus TaxID=75038 RepID=UPI001ED8145E|nr:uncharacterized protein LOC124074219 [Scatophagus argus]